MLALVVGSPPTVQVAVALRQLEGRQARQPLFGHASHRVAVAVHQHRRLVPILDPAAQQGGARSRVAVKHLHFEV